MGSNAGFSLPDKFLRHNQVDPDWLRALPDLIARLTDQWSLSVKEPFPGIEINYVAPAIRADGTKAVLKVSRYRMDTQTEIAALRLWNGEGAAHLLEADEGAGALLLERLEPGKTLAEVAESDDDTATLIASSTLRRLWRPAPAHHGLQSLESWCAAYDRNRDALRRGDGGFPTHLFRRADAVRRDLIASTDAPMVLHGDLHHFNVLRARRAPWLAIDPKGLIGDRGFDVGQFLKNPGPVSSAINRRRLDIFCAELGLDRERVKAWCLVHAVLDACWDFEDGHSWEPNVAYAQATLTF